jgi:hypothetical protein
MHYIDDAAVEFDLVPLPERPLSRELAKKHSLVVKVADLEHFVDNALKSDLLKKQHEVI